MADITYCKNPLCPFFGCERHFDKAPAREFASFATLDATCEQYIGWLARMMREEKDYELEL